MHWVSELGNALTGASAGWLALGVVLHLANQAARGRGWFAIVRTASPDDRALRPRDAILAWVAEQPDRPAAFARKVLLNRHRSLLRRAVVEARHLVASRPEDRHQPDFGGDDLVLWQALQGLPSRQRAALVLRFYLDLPEAEVASLLGVPAGTVKSWTHRGLARLRDRLGPTYAGERLVGNASTEAGP